MVGATGFERMQLVRGDTVQHCYRLLATQPVRLILSPQPSALRTSCRSLTARADRPSGASAFSAAVASGSVGCRLSQNSFTQQSITFAARPTTASRAPRAAVWGAVRQLAWHPAPRSGPKEEVQVVLKEPRSRARPE